jgi:hypothetical protein
MTWKQSMKTIASFIASTLDALARALDYLPRGVRAMAERVRPNEGGGPVPTR